MITHSTIMTIAIFLRVISNAFRIRYRHFLGIFPKIFEFRHKRLIDDWGRENGFIFMYMP